MAQWTPALKGASCIKKLDNPILTKKDIPYEAEFIFNAGVAKIGGKYVMIFRDDYGFDPTCYPKSWGGNRGIAIGVAVSDNGVDGWVVKEKPLVNMKWELGDTKPGVDLLGRTFPDYPDILRLYDPRIIPMEDAIYLCLAMDTVHGLRGCIARLSDTLDDFEIISASVPDNRNMVLFPEKINGYYVRLERPFPVYSRGSDRFDVWLSKSPDLKFWGESSLVLGVEDVPYANDKIGPAAPPVRTKYGWLTLFHAVDKELSGRGQDEWDLMWNKRYTAGIMLLDLDDPSKVIGMSKDPLIVPDMPYESDYGFRQNVIFPGGMIVEDDGEVKIYYGSADSVECLATARLEDLVALCTEPRIK
ncbi:MAG: glycoside hydrolase family 130 protein [Clostridia bacterium]|nr:glycoside hydrolase family 130 protein [Clostridia bacterium]